MPDDPELRRALMDVYRSVDASLIQLTKLKEEMTQFVERWRSKHRGTPALVPHFNDSRTLVHEDHLGASTFLEKGWSKISSGEYEEAEELLQHALTLSPHNAEGESLLGWAQMLQDKLDAALVTFQRVLSREPSNGLARINVGYICLKKGIFGEAIEHLSTALRQSEDLRATLYANFYLGLVYLEREMYDDAQVFFEHAIALGPNLVEAYFELGHALWLGGQGDGARETWKRGAMANKFNPWSRRCQELLDLLERGVTPTRVPLSLGAPSDT